MKLNVCINNLTNNRMQFKSHRRTAMKLSTLEKIWTQSKTGAPSDHQTLLLCFPADATRLEIQTEPLRATARVFQLIRTELVSACSLLEYDSTSEPWYYHRMTEPHNIVYSMENLEPSGLTGAMLPLVEKHTITPSQTSCLSLPEQVEQLLQMIYLRHHCPSDDWLPFKGSYSTQANAPAPFATNTEWNRS